MRDVYINFVQRGPTYEDNDPTDLKTLDVTSITSVADIIRKFANDSSFAPREVPTTYDSELGNINIDDDVAPEFGYGFEEVFEDSINNAREKSK